jgi:hypothetical protein
MYIFILSNQAVMKNIKSFSVSRVKLYQGDEGT